MCYKSPIVKFRQPAEDEIRKVETAALQLDEYLGKYSRATLRPNMSVMRWGHYTNPDADMGRQGISLSKLRSNFADFPSIAEIDLDNYVGYLDQRHFLFWISRFTGHRVPSTSFHTFVLYRTFPSWPYVFTPA